MERQYGKDNKMHLIYQNDSFSWTMIKISNHLYSIMDCTFFVIKKLEQNPSHLRNLLKWNKRFYE